MFWILAVNLFKSECISESTFEILLLTFVIFVGSDIPVPVIKQVFLSKTSVTMYILFDDGSQIRKPDIIVTTDVSPFNYRDYDLKAFFEIDDELFKKLSNNKITDVKLYTKSKSFNDKFGEKIRARFNCLVNDTYKLIKRFRN